MSKPHIRWGNFRAAIRIGSHVIDVEEPADERQFFFGLISLSVMLFFSVARSEENLSDGMTSISPGISHILHAKWKCQFAGAPDFACSS